ncbi:MAG: hypothetical protein ACTSRS_11890 [Candidatus Helarchaeota archaeon]
MIILRDDLTVEPEFIVVDYKPAWESAILKIFPDAIIIRCSFHTVQLVNRGISKELNRVSKGKFKNIIKKIKTSIKLSKNI